MHLTQDNEDLAHENEEFSSETVTSKTSAKRKLDQDGQNQVQLKKNYLFGTNIVGDITTRRKPPSVGSQIASVFRNKIEFFNGAQAAKPILKQQQPASTSNGPLTLCYVCNEKVFLMERQTVLDCTMHATCFRCSYCSRLLRNGYYNYSKDSLQPNSKCNIHSEINFYSKLTLFRANLL